MQNYKAAYENDLLAVRQLLAENGLAHTDVVASDSLRFVVLEDGDPPAPVAVAGLEIFSGCPEGLLRSVVVSRAFRGQGIAAHLIGIVETWAREAGLQKLWLLTTTAPGFFAKLQYVQTERKTAPAAIQRSAEFEGLCPDDSLCLTKSLDRAGPADQLVKSTWQNLRGELRGFLVGQVGEPATADDLLQDVFLKLHQRAGNLQDKASPRAWLYQVARHAVVDHWRRRRETTALSDDLAQAEAPTEQAAAARLASFLRPMIAGLPAAYAEALRLTELEQMPQAQAARLLGLSLTALKSRVRRGRSQLKGLLLRCCEFELSSGGRVLDYWPRQACCVHASVVDELREAIEAAGFAAVRIEPKDESRRFIKEWAPGLQLEDAVASALIEAAKP